MNSKEKKKVIHNQEKNLKIRQRIVYTRITTDDSFEMLQALSKQSF